MPQEAQFPFEGYRLYIVLHKKEGRRMANLVKKDTGSQVRTTMSYARYLMSVHLGRVLTEDEHVDHKNDDKLDDRIDNYQILTPAQNLEKYNRSHPKKVVDVRCFWCGTTFQMDKRNVPFRPNACCSRKCARAKQFNRDKS
jgi:hypothetical protein